MFKFLWYSFWIKRLPPTNLSMSNLQKAGAGRTKISIKSGLGRVTVYKSNNPNKPFKKPTRKGPTQRMTAPNGHLSALPNAIMVF